MSGIKKYLTIIGIVVILAAVIAVVIKPVISAHYIGLSKKYARGRFVCSLNNDGEHVSKLYKLNAGSKPKLIKKTVSNSCIFSPPKVNAGFFVFAIGGGGGATPYESGNSGQIISKYKYINKPVVVIKVGKGGHGTYVGENDEFIDARDGEDTIIEDLELTARGGSKSTRMTPLGDTPEIVDYHIPEKYYYLYDISKSTINGAGGKYDKNIKDTSAKSNNGHSGLVIIQW